MLTLTFHMHRLLVSMLLFLQRHPISSFSVFSLQSLTQIRSASAFLRFVPQRQQQFSKIAIYHNRFLTKESKLVITRQSDMNRHSSSIATADNNDIESSNKGISEHKQLIFDEKHVEKVLFVECGMFYLFFEYI